MEQAPKITPIKGFQLYSLQTTDMDLYSDPVMGIGFYKMTPRPCMRHPPLALVLNA